MANRNQEGTPFFDDLARGLDTGAISRGKAMKLSGAALVASALGLFASRGAKAQVPAADVTAEISKRKCRQKGGDYCKKSGCSACCGKGNGGGRRKKKACCGTDGCRCCKKCGKNGKCK